MKIYTIVINALAEGIERASAPRPAKKQHTIYIDDRDLKESILNKVDLDLSYTKR